LRDSFLAALRMQGKIMEHKIGAAEQAYYGLNIEANQEQPVRSTDIRVTCYENEVPSFVEAELEKLYGNVFSLLEQFRTYSGSDVPFNAYVARRGQEITTILLFTRRGSKLRVANEVIALDPQEISDFANYIFRTYPSIQVIEFHAIHTELDRLDYPFQSYDCLEDIVLELPATENEYQSQLGKNTRRNLKRYSERLYKDHPSFEFEVYEKKQIKDEYIHAIVRLNKARMAEKNKESIIDDPETARIIHMVKAYGMVGVARINNVICAGTISYRVGENYFLSVLAHEPQYDPYWIGILCCYKTIRECIARGGKEFHFLWGRYDYKFTLLAKLRALNHIVIYRSRFHYLINAATVFRVVLAGKRREFQLLMHETKHHHQHDFWTRALVGLIRSARGIKRMVLAK
jgi:hypothetical protein